MTFFTREAQTWLRASAIGLGEPFIRNFAGESPDLRNLLEAAESKAGLKPESRSPLYVSVVNRGGL
jgi:hypothetical protein